MVLVPFLKPSEDLMKLLSKIALVLLALGFVASYAEARCHHRHHGHRHHVHGHSGGCCR
jgi:hypothetical protein